MDPTISSVLYCFYSVDVRAGEPSRGRAGQRFAMGDEAAVYELRHEYMSTYGYGYRSPPGPHVPHVSALRSALYACACVVTVTVGPVRRSAETRRTSRRYRSKGNQ